MDSLDSCHIQRVYTSYLVIALIPIGNGLSFHICQEQTLALGFFFFSLLTLLTTRKLPISMIANSSCSVMHEVSLDVDMFFQLSLDVDMFFQLPFFSNYFLQFLTFDLQRQANFECWFQLQPLKICANECIQSYQQLLNQRSSNIFSFFHVIELARTVFKFYVSTLTFNLILLQL